MALNTYGRIAVEAVKLIRFHGMSPVDAWDTAKSNHVTNAKIEKRFSYQKEVFLSLCAARLIKGVDVSVELKKSPSEKAEKIANLILEFPTFSDKKIWDTLKRTEENSGVCHNGCQMDVSVVRALLLEDFLIFSLKKEKPLGLWIEQGDWAYRVDSENKNTKTQRHVHVCRKKHKSAKKMQVSWNADGTRHDKKTFYENMVGMEKAKEIASEILKIPAQNLQLIFKIDLPANNTDGNVDSEIFIFFEK